MRRINQEEQCRANETEENRNSEEWRCKKKCQWINLMEELQEQV